MSYDVFRVRRRLQYKSWIYALPGACECGKGATSGIETICSDTSSQMCSQKSATGCECPDNGYCGDAGLGGACGIKPYQYGGDILITQSGDPKLLYILQRHFVIYDATLPSAEELLRLPKYQTLVHGEPVEDVILFDIAESIEGLESKTDHSNGGQGSLDDLAKQLSLENANNLETANS